MKLSEILSLSSHGPETFVGTGPRYPWGGLYGGQIVAQSLLSAASSVDDGLAVHSLRAYFIRRGDQDEPVRYEVERLRNGRSFATRRVVARQATGAILNLEASFQADEASVDLDHVVLPADLPPPSELEVTGWSDEFERAFIPRDMQRDDTAGIGRATAWMRTTRPIGDSTVDAVDLHPQDLLVHFASLAYLSDDLPTDAVVRAHPIGREPDEVLYSVLFTASLDHTIWFHRPMRADRWHLHDFRCHGFVRGRGLAVGQIFDESGLHVASVAQEVLLRDRRERATSRSGPANSDQ
ncbi:MAG: thioesterase family protein [Microthrixaceae bacterium]|nr:thioesterase family protein [Microthrixaceae bacterium]